MTNERFVFLTSPEMISVYQYVGAVSVGSVFPYCLYDDENDDKNNCKEL